MVDALGDTGHSTFLPPKMVKQLHGVEKGQLKGVGLEVQVRNKQVVIVADSSKVGMSSPAVICPIGDIDILVTDDGVSEDAVKAFASAGVRVLIA